LTATFFVSLCWLKKQRERRKANQYMIEGGRLKPPLSAKEVAAAALLMVGSLAVSMAAQAPTSLATKRLCFAHGLHLWSRPPSLTWHGSPAHSSIARNAIFTRRLSAVQPIAPSIGKVLGERARNAMLRMSADKAGIDEEVRVAEPRTQDVAKKAADIDVEDEEWEKWKTKFSGKFVLKSKTATGTSIRAAREDSAVTAEAAQVLLLEKGRVLSFDEELMYGGGMNDIYQIDDDDEEEEDDGSVGDDIPGGLDSSTKSTLPLNYNTENDTSHQTYQSPPPSTRDREIARMHGESMPTWALIHHSSPPFPPSGENDCGSP
jgi:hypothetical protein